MKELPIDWTDWTTSKHFFNLPETDTIIVRYQLVDAGEFES